MEGIPGPIPQTPPKEEEVSKFKFTKKRALIALAVVGVLAVTGAALAYFTSSGSGSGSASVGSDAGVTIDPVTFDDTLYPGGSTTVHFTVNNSSTTSSAKVGQVVADTSGGNTNGISGLPAGCSASDFTYTPGTALNTSIDPSDSVDGTGTLAMADSTSNQDACKGASPTLHLKVDNSAL